MLFKGERTFIIRDMGGFIARINLPGWLKRTPTDHGHGPLAMVVESILHPGRLIAMHEHRNDEIISWVPDGIMRHEDKTAGRLVIDASHLMVMNAGRGFWHSEETLPTDPPLRMLQILVRPQAIDLEPKIQYGPLPIMAPNSWRLLVGPDDGSAPFHVRNAVDLFDIRLEAGVSAEFPHMQGRDLYFYVFDGSVVAGGQTFTEGEQGLLISSDRLAVEARSSSLIVAFLLDPCASGPLAQDLGATASPLAPLAVASVRSPVAPVSPWSRRATRGSQLLPHEAAVFDAGHDRCSCIAIVPHKTMSGALVSVPSASRQATCVKKIGVFQMTARAKAILAIALLFISGRDAVTADLDRGRRIFQTCASCHVLDRDRSTFGPYLKGVFGRRIGSLPDYNYSPAMKAAGADGKSWDEQTLGEFLYSPARAIPGTKMRFWGLWRSDIGDLVAFLKVQH